MFADEEPFPGTDDYLASLRAELSAVSMRVRSLIGSRHWLTDGVFKEAVFSTVLSRHLPSGVVQGKGFVVSAARRATPSREQDIILVDSSSSAPMFHEHGVIIASPNDVMATVAIKSSPAQNEILDCLDSFKSVCLRIGPSDALERIFFAAYFFGEQRLSEKQLKRAANALAGNRLFSDDHPWASGIETMIAFSSGYVMTCLRHDNGEYSTRVLNCGRHAPAVLIANIAAHIALRRGGGGTTAEIARRVADMHFPLVYSC